MTWQDMLSQGINKLNIQIEEEQGTSVAEAIKVYLDALDGDMLRGEVQKNEEQKRKYRQRLLKFVLWAIPVQTVFINVLIWSLLCKANCLSADVFCEFLSFLRFFVGATIVEILGMLAFIVHNCFDKTVSQLFGNGQKRGKK